MPSASGAEPLSSLSYIYTPGAEHGEPNAELEERTWGKLGNNGKGGRKRDGWDNAAGPLLESLKNTEVGSREGAGENEEWEQRTGAREKAPARDRVTIGSRNRVS